MGNGGILASQKMMLSVQNVSNVLLLVDIEDEEHLDIPTKGDRRNIVPEVLEFNNLHDSAEQIGRLADANDIDFLLYSQNEQVGKRCAIGAVHQHVYIASPERFVKGKPRPPAVSSAVWINPPGEGGDSKKDLQ